ncbi:MAG TPA: D-alanyl-D-alanine carboxypeptidase family protein [Pseudogracilibacillus sp.]|nr:D-alanyl-D-alanine carboxypeptidase family protein [Pseudogracilibacillus sp.]
MKKTLYIAIVSLVVATLTGQSNFTYAESVEKDPALNLTENAQASILLERDTGQVLYEKNAHEPLAPASLTKIMTLLLVMEAVDHNVINKDEKITISERAASMGGSQVFLDVGEEMSVDDLIKAIAIASANDASVALAERLAGSEAAFVKMMNDKAEQLQLENTLFQNASGLPAENHFTTAYDIAIMSRELLKYEDITNYTSIYEDYLRQGEDNEFWLVNTNRLVRFYDYVDGLKTGYTKDAQFCLAATAKKDNMRVVSVIMGAESSKERNAMTMNLIDYAFAHYETEKVYEKGSLIGKYKHIQSEQYEYPLKTSEPISILHKKGESELSYQTKVNVIENEALPIKQGLQLGSIVIQAEDKAIIESPIYAEEPIELASLFKLMKRSLKMMTKYE